MNNSEQNASTSNTKDVLHFDVARRRGIELATSPDTAPGCMYTHVRLTLQRDYIALSFFTYIYMYIYIHVYTYMYIYMYIWREQTK